MTEYEYKFNGQSNLAWEQSFNMTKRVPAISKRIFDKLSDAESFINDDSFYGTAIPGIVLSVINDSEENNGIYFVKKIKASSDDSDGILVKVGSGDVSDEELNEINTKLGTLESNFKTHQTTSTQLFGNANILINTNKTNIENLQNSLQELSSIVEENEKVTAAAINEIKHNGVIDCGTY